MKWYRFMAIQETMFICVGLKMITLVRGKIFVTNLRSIHTDTCAPFTSVMLYEMIIVQEMEQNGKIYCDKKKVSDLRLKEQ